MVQETYEGIDNCDCADEGEECICEEGCECVCPECNCIVGECACGGNCGCDAMEEDDEGGLE
tara:strand:- start:185 stop:370 length:186 start_codon:yes stop_codon:yes gene_type:complete